MKIENELWEFAKDFYSNITVSEALLSLQNQYGHNVNQLIFAIWLAAEKYKLSQICTQNNGDRLWNIQVTSPLRDIRKYVKSQMLEAGQDSVQLTQCYKQLLAAELCAEQVELGKMYADYEQYSDPAPEQDSASLIAENLALCRLSNTNIDTANTLNDELFWSALEKIAIEHINKHREQT